MQNLQLRALDRGHIVFSVQVTLMIKHTTVSLVTINITRITDGFIKQLRLVSETTVIKQIQTSRW